MRTQFPAILLLLAAAACGSGAKPAAAPEESTIAIAPDAPDDGVATPSGREGITGIDAAQGDARAMPADSAAPSAYDLAQRAERAKDAAARRDARPDPAAAPAPPGAAGDVPGTGEPVTTGD